MSSDIRRDHAVISAYTGIALEGHGEHASNFDDIHAYIDSLPGFEGITTGAMGLVPGIFDRIRAAAEADFRTICHRVGEPFEPWQEGIKPDGVEDIIRLTTRVADFARAGI